MSQNETISSHTRAQQGSNPDPMNPIPNQPPTIMHESTSTSTASSRSLKKKAKHKGKGLWSTLIRPFKGDHSARKSESHPAQSSSISPSQVLPASSATRDVPELDEGPTDGVTAHASPSSLKRTNNTSPSNIAHFEMPVKEATISPSVTETTSASPTSATPMSANAKQPTPPEDATATHRQLEPTTGLIERFKQCLQDNRLPILERSALAMKLLKDAGEAVPVAGGFIKALAGISCTVLEATRAYQANNKAIEEICNHLNTAILHLSAHPSKATKVILDKYIRKLELVEKALVDYTATHLSDHFGASQTDKEKLTEFSNDIKAAYEELMLDLNIQVVKQVEQVADQTDHLVQFSLTEAQHQRLAKLMCVTGSGGYDEKQLMDGTRKTIIASAIGWSQSENHKVFWVCDVAGTGKSTLANYLTNYWKTSHKLLGSFFFSKSELLRMTMTHVWSTLAAQIANNHKPAALHISNALGNHSLSSSPPSEQLKELIVQPLSKAQLANPMVIIFDALDELKDHARKSFLDALKVLRCIPNLRIFITSRPDITQHSDDDIVTSLLAEKVGKTEFPASDAEDTVTFIKARLGKSEDSLDPELVEIFAGKAYKLFIWAEMACKAILGYYDNAQKLKEFCDATVLPTVDEMYLDILGKASSDMNATKMLLSVLKLLLTAYEAPSPSSIAYLLGFAGRTKPVRALLNSIASLLVFGSDDAPIHFVHPTIQEMLLDETRSKKFYINLTEAHKTHAMSTLRYMIPHDEKYADAKNPLHKNMCNITEIHILNSQIPNLSEVVSKSISVTLQYSCKYYPYHVAQCLGEKDVMQSFVKFFSNHLLPWLEVLSLTGSLVLATKLLANVHTAIQRQQLNDKDQLSQVAYICGNVLQTIRINQKLIEQAALEVYSSMILYSPPGSWLRISYGHWLSKQEPLVYLPIDKQSQELHMVHPKSVTTIGINPRKRHELASGCDDGMIYIWDTQLSICIQTWKGHTTVVTSVAYSIDGNQIASGSIDHTIKLWDTAGNIEAILKGHTNWVTCLAWSSDSNHIISGSWDNTLRLWDVAGNLKAVLKGHTDLVTCLSYSPDGNHIVSGAGDHTVKLWDAAGNLKATLEGHTNRVTCIAYSPDGRNIVSGSRDNTMRLWDAAGKLEAVCTGHNKEVTCIAYSPDGRQVASGSLDCKVRLWDTALNLGNVLEGHINGVTSIGYSPEGDFVVSGSADKSVRLWSTAETLEVAIGGHTKEVTCLSFSHDGDHVASGSYDKTVRLWNAFGKLKAILEGHTKEITCIAYSPDDSYIISGSNDKTVRIWETSGKLHAVLAGHTNRVTCVAYSPDGTHIISGSRDNTVRIWDTHGKPEAVLVGHTNWLNCVIYSPDGQYLASGSDDRTFKIWNCNGNLIQTVKCDRVVLDIQFLDSASVQVHGKQIPLDLTQAQKSGPLCAPLVSPPNNNLISIHVDKKVTGTSWVMIGPSSPPRRILFVPQGMIKKYSQHDGTVAFTLGNNIYFTDCRPCMNEEL